MAQQLIQVPQRLYQAPTHFDAQPSILFTTQELPGVNLHDAFINNLAQLDGRDEPLVVTTTSNRVTLRILVRLDYWAAR